MWRKKDSEYIPTKIEIGNSNVMTRLARLRQKKESDEIAHLIESDKKAHVISLFRDIIDKSVYELFDDIHNDANYGKNIIDIIYSIDVRFAKSHEQMIADSGYTLTHDDIARINDIYETVFKDHKIRIKLNCATLDNLLTIANSYI